MTRLVREGLRWTRLHASVAAAARSRIRFRGYVQLSATTFTDSATIAGGRTTFGFAALSLSALGGSCTGPVTSTFLFTLVDQSCCAEPPSTYIDADPPWTLVRPYAVPPSVVFACTTPP